MNLEIHRFVLGPLENNSFLVIDPSSKEAIIIDPSFSPDAIGRMINSKNLILKQVWITHAHFDHIAGASYFNVPIVLHQADLSLWQNHGGAEDFGINLPNFLDPGKLISHGEKLHLGSFVFEVRHTPGHTPGHIIYYCEDESMVFCGDLIFRGSVGRTDLPGGNSPNLLNSIRTQILTLPPKVVLWPGHGESTNVEKEQRTNIFLKN